ncbi:MAG: acetate--CoA ligase family protein, partial [Candidatus Omnitrophica bacterium]|nr:acetate--CoA ligase family protein [Candidatus Omnitrophota bacterium]
MLQVAEIMQYVHGKGIAYRDLKPNNLIVGIDGNVALLDFNIATPEDYDWQTDELALSRTHQEAFAFIKDKKGHRNAMKIDINTFGAIFLWKLLGEDDYWIYRDHFSTDREICTRIEETIDSPARDIILNCIKTPDTYEGFGAIIEELREVIYAYMGRYKAVPEPDIEKLQTELLFPGEQMDLDFPQKAYLDYEIIELFGWLWEYVSPFFQWLGAILFPTAGMMFIVAPAMGNIKKADDSSKKSLDTNRDIVDSSIVNDAEAIQAVFDNACKKGRDFLYEHEVYKLLDILGIPHPKYGFVHFEEGESDEDVSEKLKETMDALPGHKVVVKVVADVIHKKKGIGVQIIVKDLPSLGAIYGRMKNRFSDKGFKGVLICEKVEHDPDSEYFVGGRFSEQFDLATMSFGLGGERVESEKDTAMMFLPKEQNRIAPLANIISMINNTHAGRSLTNEQRRILALNVRRISRLFSLCDKYLISNFDINPLVFDQENKSYALDGYLAFKLKKDYDIAKEEILHKKGDLTSLFKPRKVAVIGSFDRERDTIAKSVYNDLKDNPRLEAVYPIGRDDDIPLDIDLAVICTGRGAVGKVLEKIIKKKATEENKEIAVVAIAGGFAESETGEDAQSDLNDALKMAKGMGVTVNLLGPN